MADETLFPQSDRLNGWKDIAAYLGKGVRTVQRWEREYELPVRRVGREGGEIVFAFRSELDAWSRAERDSVLDEAGAPAATVHDDTPSLGPVTPTAPPEITSHTRTPAAGLRARHIAGLVALGVLLLAGLWLASYLTPREPITWRVEGDEFQVFARGGELLWSRELTFSPKPGSYSQDGPLGTQAALVADLDGDDLNEVLFTSRAALRSEDEGLIVYEHDGTERFRYRPDDEVTFGETPYAAPWLSHRLWVIEGPDGRTSIWTVSVHGLLFPAVVTELSPDGDVRSRYWSNGYVDSINIARWGGKPVVLIGATDNDSRGASLAIFEYGSVRGAAPAERVNYRCTDCPAGGPGIFLQFPRRCLGAATDAQATIWHTWVDDRDVLHVGVFDGPGATAAEGSVAWYTFESDQQLLGVEFGAGMSTLHRDFEVKNLVDHPYGEVDSAMVLPVRRWVGDHFEALPAAPVVLR